MQLRTFVTTALTEIISGVKDAQLVANASREGQVNPLLLLQGTGGGALSVPNGCALSAQKQSIHLVKFDVAITLERGTETKGGIGIFMGAVGIGSQGESTNSQTSLSRIQFEVPISFPYQDTSE